MLNVTNSVTQCNKNAGCKMFSKGTDDLEGYRLMDASMTTGTISDYHTPRAEPLQRKICSVVYIDRGNSEAHNSNLMVTLIRRKQWEMVPLGQKNGVLDSSHSHIRDQ